MVTRYLTHQTLAGTQFTLFEPRHSLKAYANYRLGGGRWSIGGGAQVTSAVAGTGVAGTREHGGYGVASVQVGYQMDAQTTCCSRCAPSSRTSGVPPSGSRAAPRAAALRL